jgi:hypothetical protein
LITGEFQLLLLLCSESNRLTGEALVNYRWSVLDLPNGLTDPADKGIAGILVFLLYGSSVWYYGHGAKDTSAAVLLAGSVQAWAAFF